MSQIELIKPVYSAVKSVNGQIGEVELTAKDVGATTEEVVIQKIAEAQLSGGDVDLSAYYTKTETDAAISEAVENIDIPAPDLSGYATEQYVDEAIAGVDVDLTDYAKKEYVDEAIAGVEVDLTGYATEQFVNDAVAAVDVDLTGYATEKYVDDAIANIETGEIDLQEYAKISYVDEAIANIELTPGEKGDTGATPHLTIGDVSIVGAEEPGTVEITGTAENPVLNFSIPMGYPGDPGEPGYTPERGVDYWTDDDKTEIINSVLEALPAAEEVGF